MALHYIGFREGEAKANGKNGREKCLRLAARLQDIEAFDEAITDHLLSLIRVAWDSPDAGAVHSARFAPSPAGSDQALLRQRLQDIRRQVWPPEVSDSRAGERFLALSRAIAERLYNCTPPCASPGLLLVADFTLTATPGRHLALLKIRHTDERFVTILQTSLTDLAVRDVKMMLTREVLKGVIWPHPTRSHYDLKLVDKQAGARPPRYFTRDFLGCQVKAPDAQQAKELWGWLPKRIADDCGLTFDGTQALTFIHRLRQQTAPTAKRVAAIAVERGLIDGDVRQDQLHDAVEAKWGDHLFGVTEARHLLPGLKAIARNEGWTYHPQREGDFCPGLEDAMRLDDDTFAAAAAETGLLKDTQPAYVRQAVGQYLADQGLSLDIPRKTFVKHNGQVCYSFKVPRLPASADFVTVKVCGPPETLAWLLEQENGADYVLHIPAAAAGFSVERG